MRGLALMAADVVHLDDTETDLPIEDGCFSGDQSAFALRQLMHMGVAGAAILDEHRAPLPRQGIPLEFATPA